MRPLHSLLVFAAILLLAGGAWLFMRTGAPEQRVTPAGPAVSLPDQSEAVAAPSDLRAPAAGRAAQRSEPPLESGAAPAPSVAAAQQELGGTQVVGRVHDELGAPVADALVLATAGNLPFFAGTPIDGLRGARWFDVVEARTDAQGRFELAGLEAGALKLGVRRVGFAPYDADNVPRPAMPGQELAPITLARGVSLAGRVVDAGGRPVPGARVQRSAVGSGLLLAPGTGGGTPLAATAADGSFLVDIQAPGAWSLRFESDAHPDAELSGRTQAAGERVDGLLVQLAEAAEIAGRVSGELPAGRAFAQLRVRARPQGAPGGEGGPGAEARRAEIAPDGTFVVRGVRAGLGYSLNVIDGGAQGGELDFGFAPGVSAPVEALAGARGVVLQLSPEAALTFSVVDAQNGAPIEDFSVEAGIAFPVPQMGEDGRRLRAHPGGLARVGNLRPRNPGERATLRIEAVGYLSHEVEDLKLTPGVDTDLGSIALEPAPVLSVRVLDALAGAPIQGANVTLKEVLPSDDPGGGRSVRMTFDEDVGGDGDLAHDFDPGQSRQARTDADGVARLTAFAGVESVLRVRAAGHAPWSSEPFVGSGEGQEREVRLGRGGSVVVHLFDAAGEPLAGGGVQHRAGADGAESFGSASPQVTNTAGEATFEHLAPGLHRFRPAKTGGAGIFTSGAATFAMSSGPGDAGGTPWAEVAVSEGGLHDLELHAPLQLAVFGELSEGGEPLADAALALVKGSGGGGPPLPMFEGSGPQATSGADGGFRFEGVEPGEYTLRIQHARRAMPAELPVRVLDVDLRVDLDLDVAILEGRVTDSAGEPLVGIEVWPERARPQGQGQATQGLRIMAFVTDGGGSSVVSLDEGGFAGVRARTDEKGRYSLRGVLTDVELEVRSKGANLQPGRSAKVRVAADETRTGVDLSMQSAGGIAIEAVRADGSPAGMLLITARYEGEAQGVEPKTALLDESGRATLAGLAPGNWRLSARAIGINGGEEQTIPDTVVEVRAGENTPTTLSAP